MNAQGDIANYYPDFIVKTDERKVFIVETKGLQDLDVPLKMSRLKAWCRDMNSLQTKERFGFVFVEEKPFVEAPPTTFAELVASFSTYQ